MAYSDETMFPRGIFAYTGLGTAAQAVQPNANSLKICGGVIMTGASARTITARRFNNGGDYFQIAVPANTVVPLPSFTAEAGLEFIASAGNDSVVLVTYFRP